jgi:uncharacterized protein with HEPN domain
MRRDRERLLDILEALDSLKQITEASAEAEFLSSDLQYHAVGRLLTVVGEAASRLSIELRERSSDVRWRSIISLRNILVHEYFGVHRPMVWEVATTDARRLREQIVTILQGEFPD